MGYAENMSFSYEFIIEKTFKTKSRSHKRKLLINLTTFKTQAKDKLQTLKKSLQFLLKRSGQIS